MSGRRRVRGSHPEAVHQCAHPGCGSHITGMGDIAPKEIGRLLSGRWTWDGKHLWCLNHGPNAEKH